MEFTIKTASPEKFRTAMLVAGAWADGTLPPASASLDQASGGRISALLKRGDLEEKTGSTLLLTELPGVAAERVLLVSLGKADEFGDKAFRDALAAAAKALAGGVARDAGVLLADIACGKRTPAWRLQQATRMLADGAYRFDVPRAVKDTRKERGARKLTLIMADKPDAGQEAAVLRGQAIAEGMALTRNLGNQPGNVCTPSHLAETAKTLGAEFGFDVEVLEREDMEKLGMGALLSVARGSHEAPKLIVMQYKGASSKARPVVLVGKGVTFDSGGISLKPGAEMDEMRFDMCGAASVLGVFRTVARLALPINLVGIVPATENMPDGKASRPGDVVKSMSGQSIEILNTDAEGRLILCDALTYAERFKPECVIDIATLTGACVIALGKIPSGLLANDDDLAAELLKCGTESGDRAWQLPLWEEYQDLLKSNFADMGNIGGRYAGAITAACFLARYTKPTNGRTWTSPAPPGCRARPREPPAGRYRCWPSS